MNLKEVLKIADDIVFTKTGQHLDDLQEAILQGTLQGKKYTQIAEEIHCSESYARDIGSKLWQILSEELGEEVKKSNFGSTMRRLIFSNVSFEKEAVAVGSFEKEVVVISSFNVCGEARHPPDIPNQETPNSKHSETLNHDLSEMPALGVFYDRNAELETLKTWILEQRCQLITLTGMSGIGKTSLAAQLVQQIKDEFEYVVWCNLDEAYTLDELQHQFIQFFWPENSPNQQKPLSFIKYLQKYRCLIILDNIHHLFCAGELAGKYRPESEDYRSFFKQIESLSHQSCFLIIGWEQPREVIPVKNRETVTRTLPLTGLDITAAREILRDYELDEMENWESLIHCYQGNPFWLKSVATQIQELGKSVTDLLNNHPIFLPEDLKDSLQQQFNRLSNLEKQLLLELAKENEAINLARLIEMTRSSATDLLNALQSLSRRCLIENQDNFYSLSPVLRQYLLTFSSTR